jgi:hypothetical protein
LALHQWGNQNYTYNGAPAAGAGVDAGAGAGALLQEILVKYIHRFHNTNPKCETKMLLWLMA